MKKTISIILTIFTVILLSQAGTYAYDGSTIIKEGNLTVLVTTDKAAYSLTNTAKFNVCVKNDSNTSFHNVVVAVSSDEYSVRTGNTYSNLIEDFDPGDSVSIDFEAILNSKSVTTNIFAKFFLSIKNLFTLTKKFEAPKSHGQKYKNEVVEISHANLEPKITVTVWYDYDKDFVEFGTYPQNKITDIGLIEILNSQTLNWKSYEYYTDTHQEDYDGQMIKSDYMKYCDISYNGQKYRAVKFDSYRTFSTCYPSSSDKGQSGQDENGYTPNNVYWFKFEPITWKVLDADKGLVMCTKVIDSQSFNGYVEECVGALYGSPQKSFYANDYSESEIRTWLNKDFYSTAFSEAERDSIKTTELETECIGTVITGGNDYIEFDTKETFDKIFLLSFAEATNDKYEFSDFETKDRNRLLKGTDYAKCQGLSNYTEKSAPAYSWWLRSSYIDHYSACVVYNNGDVNHAFSVDDTFVGIVPAMCIELN